MLEEKEDVLRRETSEKLFQMDTKIDICMKMGDDAEICKNEVIDIKNSVVKMQKNTLETLEQYKKEFALDLVNMNKQLGVAINKIADH